MIAPLSICVLLLSAAPSFLAEYEEQAVPTGRLFSRGWSERDRKVVASFLPDALSRVEAALGCRLEHPFTTILVPHRQELDRVARALQVQLPSPEVVLGLALPSQRTLIVREGLLPGTGPFRTTLTHEVAHLVLHRRVEARIPKWFDEGVAQWVSGASLAPSQEAYLSFLARVGAIYPLEKLEYRFPPTHETTAIAYQQSQMLVTYLVERYTVDVLGRLLARFEEGLSTTAALREVTGRDLAAIEERFTHWLSGRRSWFAAIASLLNLWTIAAVLALVAILRHYLRRRRRLREMAREEAEGEEEWEEEPSSPSELRGSPPVPGPPPPGEA